MRRILEQVVNNIIIIITITTTTTTTTRDACVESGARLGGNVRKVKVQELSNIQPAAMISSASEHLL
jgi:hypothetical protein